MRVKKKTVQYLFFILLFLGLLVYGVKIYSDAEGVWNDTATWETTPHFLYPVPKENVSYSVEHDAAKKTTTFSAPVCTLYKSEVKGKLIQYFCTLTAPQILELSGKVENFTPSQDIILTFEYGKDPSPSNFFSISPLDERTFQIAGQRPIEVSLNFVIKEEKPQKTPVQLIKHSLLAKIGKKESYPVSLLSWEMEEAIVANLKKAGGKEKFIKAWGESTINEINKELRVRKVDTLEGQDLLNALRQVFQYQNSKCAVVNGITKCQYSYPQNAADSLIYYLYAVGSKDPENPLYKKILNAVKMYTLPFLNKYNASYQLPVSPECGENVPETECVEFYQIMNAYQYSICPIKDVLSGNKTSAAMKFFSDYIELANVAKVPSSQEEALKYIRAIPAPEESNSSGFPDFKSSVNINIGCYAASKFGIQDKEILAILEKRYFESISLKLAPKSKVPLKEVNDVQNYIVSQVVGNVYTRFPYIADSSIVLARNETKLELVPEQIENQVAWGNVPLSLALLYLSQQ